jgi:hypothetical protein
MWDQPGTLLRIVCYAGDYGDERWHSRCEDSAFAMSLIVVKRGALSTFRFLEQSCKNIAGLQVIWDRRRHAATRARTSSIVYDERRGQVPYSWTAADHVFVHAEQVELLTPAGPFEANDGTRAQG